MRVKRLLLILFIVLLAGCTPKLGGDAFYSEIDEVENSLEQKDWKVIMQNAKKLKKVYQKEKWKIQLLGDEGEYEDLLESLNRLIAAAQEEDSANARLELATAKTLVDDIYSL